MMFEAKSLSREFLNIAMYVLKDFKIGKNSGCMLFEIQNFIFFFNFVPFVILLVS